MRWIPFVIGSALFLALVVLPARAQTGCDWWQGYTLVDGELVGSEILPCVEPVPTPEPTAVPTAVPTATPAPPTRTPTRTPTGVPPTSTVLPATPTTVSPTPVSGRVVSPGPNAINNALNAASPGETLLLRVGTYTEQVVADVEGITFTLYGDGPVWIDGGCARQFGFFVQADDVTIRGLGIKRTIDAGVRVGPNGTPARTTIDGAQIQDYNCKDQQAQQYAGVAAWYAGSGQTITNSTITRRVQVSGPQAGQGNGIWFKSNSGNPSGGGHVISGNTIVGGYDGIGGEDEFDPRGGFDRNTTISGNTIRNCGDDGIQVEGGGQNVVVENNTITSCGIGIAFATNLTGPLTIRGNTITASAPGLLGAQTCYKTGNNSSAQTNLINNRCTQTGTPGSNLGKGIQQTNSGMGVIYSRNNVWITNSYALEFLEALGAGSSFDTDCFTTADPNRFVKWRDVVYLNLASFRSATGQELSGRMGPC